MNNSQYALAQAFNREHVPYVNTKSSDVRKLLRNNSDGIPSEARTCIAKFETAIVALAEKQDSNTLWTHGSNVRCRSEFPIWIAPQRMDKHEFDVSTHCLWTAWAVAHIEKTIIQKLPVDLQNCDIIRRMLATIKIDSVLQNTWALTAYLHDVEKTLEQRTPYDINHPWAKSTKQGEKKISLAQNTRERDFSEYEILYSLFYDPSYEQLFDRNFPQELRGIFNNEPIDRRSLLAMYEIYKIVDLTIIAHAYAGTNIPQEDLINTAEITIAATANPLLQIMGVLIMAADNYAQGLPPEADAQLIAERVRNYNIVVAILRKINDFN